MPTIQAKQLNKTYQKIKTSKRTWPFTFSQVNMVVKRNVFNRVVIKY